MERLTEWNGEQTRHAYYPRCFEEPCYGSGCKIKDCPFETAVCDRLAAYEDTGREPEEVTALEKLFDYALKESKTLMEQLALLHHIRELAEADKDGRVVVLPCKVGDELWTWGDFSHGREVYRFTVSDVSTMNGRTVLNTLGLGTIRPEDIGKTVFLTREEAERAMEGRKESDHA